MKKLITMIIAAFAIATSFAITADEAIQSKNYYTISKYCIDNKIGTMQFLIKSNSLDRTQFVAIYNSITNPCEWSTTVAFDYIKFNKKSNQDKEIYEWAKDNLCSSDKINYNVLFKMLTSKYISKYWFQNKYCETTFTTQHLFGEFMKSNIGLEKKASVCFYFYELTKDKKYLDMIDYNELISKKLYSSALDYAIITNNVDKIIDSLLLVVDITSTQANAIIAPINAVESKYRKSEIVSVLENINSRCTIKLYDDQKTWEPILAKIRAMINIRK